MHVFHQFYVVMCKISLEHSLIGRKDKMPNIHVPTQHLSQYSKSTIFTGVTYIFYQHHTNRHQLLKKTMCAEKNPGAGEFSEWMSNLPSSLHDKPITQLAIPGKIEFACMCA